MENPFDIYDYNCDSLPSRLWRVRYASSQCRTKDGDIVARDYDRSIESESELKEAIEAHLVWKNHHITSCFLSAFTDWRHAWNWAQQRRRWDNSVEVCEITRDLLDDTCVLDISDGAIQNLNRHRSTGHEVLILHRIPFLAWMDVDEPRKGILLDTRLNFYVQHRDRLRDAELDCLEWLRRAIPEGTVAHGQAERWEEEIEAAFIRYDLAIRTCLGDHSTNNAGYSSVDECDAHFQGILLRVINIYCDVDGPGMPEVTISEGEGCERYRQLLDLSIREKL
ncbi:hypothetical protein G7046_g7611 [Stylonectria norvegica]|nr:hypothetical protein G7046_g7611 [Stylonectria norvegica]